MQLKATKWVFAFVCHCNMRGYLSGAISVLIVCITSMEALGTIWFYAGLLLGAIPPVKAATVQWCRIVCPCVWLSKKIKKKNEKSLKLCTQLRWLQENKNMQPQLQQQQVFRAKRILFPFLRPLAEIVCTAYTRQFGCNAFRTTARQRKFKESFMCICYHCYSGYPAVHRPALIEVPPLYLFYF